MIVAGADISADMNGRNEHMAIVVGEESSVNTALKELDYKFDIHMRKIRNENTKYEILKKLDFEKHGILGLCVRTERQYIIKTLLSDKKNTRPNRRILNAIDYRLFQFINPILTDYLAPRNCARTDVLVQCDSDCRATIKINSMKCVSSGAAYRLADITAWGNTHQHHPHGTRRLELKDKLLETVRRMLR